MEAERNVTDLERLSEGERLNGTFGSHSSTQQGFPSPRGEISIRAWAGMIGVRVRDDGAVHRRSGIDIEIARGTVQTGIARFEEGHACFVYQCIG